MGSGKIGAAEPTQRQRRVAEEIRHLLAAEFLRADFRDPDLAGLHVTVAEVRIGPDLRHATAFVSLLGGDVAPALPALRRAAPMLRARLAKQLRLRVAPELQFEADTAIDYAMSIDALLRRPQVARDLASDADSGPQAIRDPDPARDPAPARGRDA